MILDEPTIFVKGNLKQLQIQDLKLNGGMPCRENFISIFSFIIAVLFWAPKSFAQ